MKVEELINILKQKTNNLEFMVKNENKEHIEIYTLLKHFKVYGYMEFVKDALNNKQFKDKYIELVVEDFAQKLGQKIIIKDR